jgi:hypothetical protein
MKPAVGPSYAYQWRPIVSDVRSEVFTAATMKNGVFWDVTPCGSYKSQSEKLK